MPAVIHHLGAHVLRPAIALTSATMPQPMGALVPRSSDVALSFSAARRTNELVSLDAEGKSGLVRSARSISERVLAHVLNDETARSHDGAFDVWLDSFAAELARGRGAARRPRPS
jgi:hypothetical protein